MDARLNPVVSSNVAGYLYDGGDLIVQFKNDGIYQYSGVPQNVVDAFKAAPSKGKFLNLNVKKQFVWKLLAQADFESWCSLHTHSAKAKAQRAKRESKRTIMSLADMIALYPAMGLMF